MDTDVRWTIDYECRMLEEPKPGVDKVLTPTIRHSHPVVPRVGERIVIGERPMVFIVVDVQHKPEDRAIKVTALQAS